MAKARSIPGLRCDTPFGEAAARTIRVRAEEVFAHAEGVLDTADIERVHDMRVATRRLRAALELYEACFPKRAFREALRDVKALADALGVRRDPDVQLAATKVPGTKFPPASADRPGLESFAAALRERQARGNEVLAEGLKAARESALAQRLVDLAATAGPG